jgi:hypothetical protein
MVFWNSQDMAGLWKCLKMGTGARRKSNSYFCHQCVCNFKDMFSILLARRGVLIVKKKIVPNTITGVLVMKMQLLAFRHNWKCRSLIF